MTVARLVPVQKKKLTKIKKSIINYYKNYATITYIDDEFVIFQKSYFIFTINIHRLIYYINKSVVQIGHNLCHSDK